EGVNLTGARLTFAQLEQANLGRATLERVEFVNADLRDAYLGGSNLTNANLKNAQMENANFEEANLTEVDFRNAKLRGAKLTGTTMTGVKLYGCELDVDRLVHVVAEWVDFSEFADGRSRCSGELFAEQYQQMKKAGASSPTAQTTEQGKRFFGRGDVLRNAALEFGDKSQVEIESRFENCSISLGSGAVLKLGKHGVLQGCQIVGFGEIDIAGEFRENGKSPGIVGPKRIIVRKDGVVSGSVQQPPTMTEFAFENGCHLQLKIQK
ncbi:MAG TPA: pentapeptide repeat-containing protein, partial [Pyrinomonadaceae bacterium]